MTSYSVFAVGQTKELFLGYTTSSSDSPRELLAEMLQMMSPARSKVWVELQRLSTVSIAKREIPSGDRIADSLDNGQYLQGGLPYLADR